MKEKKLYSIGQIARKTNTPASTIRYYESIGLLPEPIRTPAGYRQYTSSDLSRLLFIQRAKNLGFSLKEIQQLLRLMEEEESLKDPKQCQKIQDIAQTKIEELQQKIQELQELKNTLATLVQKCEQRTPRQKCPIVESLKGAKSPKKAKSKAR